MAASSSRSPAGRHSPTRSSGPPSPSVGEQAIEGKEHAWQLIKRQLAEVVAPMDKLIANTDDDEVAAEITRRRRIAMNNLEPVMPQTSLPTPGSAHVKLSSEEIATLRKLTKRKPATRTLSEVRSILHLLRGADLLLKLEDDAADVVAAALRIKEYAKGDVIATEANASDSYLVVVDGMLTVLVRDMSSFSQRAPLMHLVGGECFAEAKLREHAKKQPSLVAGERAVVLRVTHDDFIAAHASWQLELLERKVEVLSSVACLSAVDKRMLRPLAERMTQERVHANVVLLTQGREAERLFVIASGEGRVLLRTSAGEMLQVRGRRARADAWQRASPRRPTRPSCPPVAPRLRHDCSPRPTLMSTLSTLLSTLLAHR